MTDTKQIRNFSIIAHIDHPSTIALRATYGARLSGLLRGIAI